MPPKESPKHPWRPQQWGWGVERPWSLPSGAFPTIRGKNNSQSCHCEAGIVFLEKNLRRGSERRACTKRPGLLSMAHFCQNLREPPFLLYFTGTGSVYVCAMGGRSGPRSNDRARMMWPRLDLAVYPLMSWSRVTQSVTSGRSQHQEWGWSHRISPCKLLGPRSTFKGQLIKLLFWPSF